MASFSREADAASSAASRAGAAIGNAFSWDGWKRANAAARSAAEAAQAAANIPPAPPGPLARAGAAAGSAISVPFRGMFKAGAWVVEQPFALAMKPVKWTLNGVAGFYTRFPRFAPVATVGAVVIGGATWLQRRAERSTQEAVADQIAAANQQASMMAAARQQSQNPYMLAPGEFAEAEAKMRGSEPGTPSGGHGARVQAQRQAAAAATTPPVDVAAL